MNIDTLISEIWSIREELRDLAKQKTELDNRFKTAKYELLAKLDEQGVSGTKTSVARVHITESQVANVTDKDLFWDYVLEHQAFHLIHKHPAANAVKELAIVQGESVPGVTLLTLRDISLTTVR